MDLRGYPNESPERQGTLAFDSSMIEGMVKYDLNHDLIGLDFFQSQDVIVSKFQKLAKKMSDDVEDSEDHATTDKSQDDEDSEESSNE